MTQKDQLRNLTKAIKASSEKRTKGYFAMLGDLTGQVLTGIANMVYVTTFEGQVKTVLNRRVPNNAGTVVLVGMDENSANRIEVLRTLDPQGGTNNGEGFSQVFIPPHSHPYNSTMPTWVQAAQFLPLLTLPYSGLTVQVYPGLFVASDGTLKWWSGGTVDMTSYVPGSGALWAILQLDDDATISVEVGSTQTSRTLLDESYIPDATTGKRIVAIVLEHGATVLSRNEARNDFLDLRFFAMAEGYIHDAAEITYTPLVVDDWDYLADPGDSADALDQLAHRVRDLEDLVAALVAYVGF